MRQRPEGGVTKGPHPRQQPPDLVSGGPDGAPWRCAGVVPALYHADLGPRCLTAEEASKLIDMYK